MSGVNFNKKNIVKIISNKSGLSTNFIKKIVNDLFEILTVNIKSGFFNLSGIGSFKVIHKNQRIGRNPLTKKEFIISSRKSISFRSSQKLSKKVENNSE